MEYVTLDTVGAKAMFCSESETDRSLSGFRPSFQHSQECHKVFIHLDYGVNVVEPPLAKQYSRFNVFIPKEVM